MPNAKKMGLGKGLSALLGDDNELSTETVMFLKTLSLLPSPFQPRKNFEGDALTDLAQSISEKGVLQPVLVRKKADGNYEIIAGERRWRAAKQAGLQEIPVIIKEFADKEALEVALIENILRENLNPLEEAEGYRRLIDEFKNTQEQLAKALGKSRSYIANSLRLLGLPAEVKDMLASGLLTAGHARSLITAANPKELAQKIINAGLNVRQTEKLTKEAKGKAPIPAKTKAVKPRQSDDLQALEEDLSEKLKTPVSIKLKGNKGSITINFKGFEKLDDLLEIISRAAKLQK